MKISIVIPTRERAKYLRYSLQTALEIDDQDIEIVVSDNASCDDTRAVVEEIDDPRLIYVNTGARVSMRENFNRAFLATSGDYLIYFGDDDGILPGQFKYLRRLLEQYRPDGVSWGRCTYGWPIPGFGRKTGGIRLHRKNSFGDVTKYEASKSRDDLLACNLYDMVPIPEIYHGCMSREYLARTSSDPDVVFDSSIPDICVSYRSVLKDGCFVHANHCFSINGYSPASTGGGHASSQNKTGNDSTSRQFATESKSDPVTDVIGHASSVPLAFFSTLETVKERYGLGQYKPDYLAWYRYVLSSARNDRALKDQLASVLKPHAEATNSTPQLTDALAMPLQAKRTRAERLEKAYSILKSFRVSAQIDGENTILTAAHTLDTILGDNFDLVLKGEQTAKSAWREAKRRSRQFVREL